MPSGRVSLDAARRLGWRLLVLGVVLGTGAGLLHRPVRSGVVAALLATAILLYDAWLKRTPLGPVAMGGCRMLNVLLGMSASTARCGRALAGGRRHRRLRGRRHVVRPQAKRRKAAARSLVAATLVMMLGMAMLAWLPRWSDRIHSAAGMGSRSAGICSPAALGLLIVWRCFRAVIEPLPGRVRMAVAHCRAVAGDARRRGLLRDPRHLLGQHDP